MIYDEFDKVVFSEIDAGHLSLEELKIVDAVLASKENPLDTALTDYIWEIRMWQK